MKKNRDSELVLESVIRMTERNDREYLEQLLLKTFYEFVSIRAAEFYQVIFRANREEVVKLLAKYDASGLYEPDDCLPGERNRGESLGGSDYLACRSSMDIVRREINGGRTLRYICPIREEGRLSHFLSLECTSKQEALLSADRKVVLALLGIYRNFLALINDSQKDKLTGLFNRKTFDEQINRIVAKSARSMEHGGRRNKGTQAPVCHWLAIFDVDHFKKINDRFGHLYGDEVLLLVAKIMRDSFRHSDLLFRYGGEEFIIVIAPCSAADAEKVLQRFKSAIEHYDFPQVGRVTVSIGFTEMTDGRLPLTMVERADQALYFAKEHGRNLAFSYEGLVADGKLKVRRKASRYELF